MNVTIKSREEIGYIRESGRLLKSCHDAIRDMIKPGLTTMDIEAFVVDFLEKRGAVPAQLGYRGYPYATCASVNEVVCHGFPNTTPLANGDVVTIDMVVDQAGWLADSAWTYPVGEVSPQLHKLLETTEKALYEGIAQARVGMKTGDIGHVIEKIAKKNKYGVVKPLVGHGIGRSLHEPPDVPSYGKKKEGYPLSEGMVITVEPIFTLGHSGAVFWDDDGWGIRTADGTIGVQYEHTIAIFPEGPMILTN